MCGTDIHLLEGMLLPEGVDYPLRPGHEVSGVVIERGAEADVALGAHVVLHPLQPCGVCPACAGGNEQRCPTGRILGFHDPGGMADEVVWPAGRLVDVGELDLEQAALLPDAVATAYHALRVADVPEGGALSVIGAGGVGTHVLQLARVLVPDVRLVAVVRSDATAARVGSLGVHVVQDLAGAARRVRAEVGELDAVVDFSGAPLAASEAVRMLGRGGRLVLGSVVDEPVELRTTVTGVVTRELQMFGAYSSSIGDLRAVVDLASSGRLELSGSVSMVLGLEDMERAFELVADRPGGMVRLVLRP